MASITMAMPMTTASQKRVKAPRPDAFFKALVVKKSSKGVFVMKCNSKTRVEIEASMKEKVVKGLTTAALTAAVVIPEVAQAAGSDLSPSLKNFLLSIASGGVVLVAIFGAVIGVSNFDPVKRS